MEDVDGEIGDNAAVDERVPTRKPSALGLEVVAGQRHKQLADGGVFRIVRWQIGTQRWYTQGLEEAGDWTSRPARITQGAPAPDRMGPRRPAPGRGSPGPAMAGKMNLVLVAASTATNANRPSSFGPGRDQRTRLRGPGGPEAWRRMLHSPDQDRPSSRFVTLEECRGASSENSYRDSSPALARRCGSAHTPWS